MTASTRRSTISSAQKMPVVELALELSQAATQSTALAARFSEVETVQQRCDADRRARQGRGPPDGSAAAHRRAGQGRQGEGRRRRSTSSSRQINDINDLTGDRLRNAAEQATALGQLSKAREGFTALADFETGDAQFNVKMNIASATQLTGNEVEEALGQHHRQGPRRAADRPGAPAPGQRARRPAARNLAGREPREARTAPRRASAPSSAQVRGLLAAAEKLQPNPARGQAVNAVIDLGEGAERPRSRSASAISTTRAAIEAGLKQTRRRGRGGPQRGRRARRTARRDGGLCRARRPAPLIEQSKIWLGGDRHRLAADRAGAVAVLCPADDRRPPQPALGRDPGHRRRRARDGRRHQGQ